MNDNSDELKPPHVGEIIAAVETLNMRVHVLERALAGTVAFATSDQRLAVQRLVDNAGASYTPILGNWPQMKARMQQEMAKVVASYRSLFSA